MTNAPSNSSLGSRQVTQEGASGGTVLLLSHASVGASVDIAFETALTGTYALRLDAWLGPDAGDYSLALDGQPLLELRGYAPSRRLVHRPGSARMLEAGRHVLVATCVGQSEISTGSDARLDALVGEPPSGEPLAPP